MTDPFPSIDTVRPSDFDISARWCWTLSNPESEELARALCGYLAENGDEWAPVPAATLISWADQRRFIWTRSWAYLSVATIRNGDTVTDFVMPRQWIHVLLQVESLRARKPTPSSGNPS